MGKYDDDLFVSDEEDIVPNNAPIAPRDSKPSRRSSRRSSSSPRKKMWQTQVREAVTPYLPPPVVRLIRQKFDPELKAYGVGSEGTVTVVTTMLVGWIMIQTIRILTRRLFRRSGRAISDDDDDVVLGADVTPHHDESVLLMGPSGAGKTRLFYRLCFGPEYSKMQTVASIKANVGFIANDLKRTIRCVDWPGYASLNDKVLETILRDTDRILLVLDASQPVAPAADILYHLCADKKKKRQIFVACHKSDLSRAKNWRRIKIQIRSEMERLLSLRPDPWWPGKTLDLAALGSVKLHFDSSSCESRLPPELVDFCLNGKLPESK